MFHITDLNKGGRKESMVWKHFIVENRDKKTHRRKGTCNYCGMNFHDSRLDILQKHVIYTCKVIPEEAKKECVDEKAILDTLRFEGKRVPKKKKDDKNLTSPAKKSKLDNSTTDSIQSYSQNGDTTSMTTDNTSNKTPPTTTMELSKLLWNHFVIGPRNMKTHRRTAECKYCHSICVNPRLERLQDHITKYCLSAPSDIKHIFKKACTIIPMESHGEKDNEDNIIDVFQDHQHVIENELTGDSTHTIHNGQDNHDGNTYQSYNNHEDEDDDVFFSSGNNNSYSNQESVALNITNNSTTTTIDYIQSIERETSSLYHSITTTSDDDNRGLDTLTSKTSSTTTSSSIPCIVPTFTRHKQLSVFPLYDRTQNNNILYPKNDSNIDIITKETKECTSNTPEIHDKSRSSSHTSIDFNPRFYYESMYTPPIGGNNSMTDSTTGITNSNNSNNHNNYTCNQLTRTSSGHDHDITKSSYITTTTTTATSINTSTQEHRKSPDKTGDEDYDFLYGTNFTMESSTDHTILDNFPMLSTPSLPSTDDCLQPSNPSHMSHSLYSSHSYDSYLHTFHNEYKNHHHHSTIPIDSNHNNVSSTTTVVLQPQQTQYALLFPTDNTVKTHIENTMNNTLVLPINDMNGNSTLSMTDRSNNGTNTYLGYTGSNHVVSPTYQSTYMTQQSHIHGFAQNSSHIAFNGTDCNSYVNGMSYGNNSQSSGNHDMHFPPVVSNPSIQDTAMYSTTAESGPSSTRITRMSSCSNLPTINMQSYNIHNIVSNPSLQSQVYSESIHTDTLQQYNHHLHRSLSMPNCSINMNTYHSSNSNNNHHLYHTTNQGLPTTPMTLLDPSSSSSSPSLSAVAVAGVAVGVATTGKGIETSLDVSIHQSPYPCFNLPSNSLYPKLPTATTTNTATNNSSTNNNMTTPGVTNTPQHNNIHALSYQNTTTNSSSSSSSNGGYGSMKAISNDAYECTQPMGTDTSTTMTSNNLYPTSTICVSTSDVNTYNNHINNIGNTHMPTTATATTTISPTMMPNSTQTPPIQYQMMFVCRYCQHSFETTGHNMNILKEHLIYSCKEIPKHLLNEFIEGEVYQQSL